MAAILPAMIKAMARTLTSQAAVAKRLNPLQWQGGGLWPKPSP
jgi:hypothetical protein